jgi:hypothetical protein
MVMLFCQGGMGVGTVGRTIVSIRQIQKASPFLMRVLSNKSGYITHASNRLKIGKDYPTHKITQRRLTFSSLLRKPPKVDGVSL